MEKNKFKILCRTGKDYWHCMDKTYDSIEEATERAKKYVWDAIVVEIKEIILKGE